MAYKFNPFTGKLDNTGAGGGGGSPGGSNTQIQFNDSGAFGGDADLTWNKTTNVMTVGGDIDLDDGGTYTTTLQTITPTANRTISYPDATGTLALVAGSSGQLIYNSAGANAGVSGSVVGATGDVALSLAGAASTPPLKLSGTWFSGGTATTTKPQLLIEPSGTTSTAWSTSGTGLGVNAASGFAGNLLDLQVGGTSAYSVSSGGITKATETRNGTSSFYSRIWQSGGIGVLSNQAADIAQWGAGFFYSYGALGVRANTGLAVLDADAANTLAQRNSTNAQTYRLYNTYTDASNYQRTSITDDSTGLVIDQQYAGTGAVRTNLLDLKVNGASRAAISSAGNLSLAGNETTVTLNNAFSVSGGFVIANQLAHLASSSFVNLNWKINWSTSTVIAGSSQTTALSLGADAANTLAQRNGANAQTYRLYNTYTDASNYERAKLSWNSNVFEIGTEGTGTGSEKPVRITAATLKLPNLPTYADNTAATSGGLVAGDVYKTATGELRITV